MAIDGKNIALEWAAVATLQAADEVTGPWADVAGGASGKAIEHGDEPRIVNTLAMNRQLFHGVQPSRENIWRIGQQWKARL